MKNSRDFWDYTVLRKEVESSEVQSIYLEKRRFKIFIFIL